MTRKGQVMENRTLNNTVSITVNVFRSIPFIILIVWMIPFTRMLVGTSIGVQAALVPLSIGAAPFIARMVENNLLDVPYGLIEAARAMGATPMQIVRKVLIPEALPSIVNSASITLITLVGYSAMGGAVGAGGLLERLAGVASPLSCSDAGPLDMGVYSARPPKATRTLLVSGHT